MPQLDGKAELLGFSTACEAMALQASECEQLLQCMAGLLHLGNIEFNDGSGSPATGPATGPAVAIAARSSLPKISEISGDGGAGGGGGLAPRAAVRADCAAAVREAARHLGIEQAALEAALASRKMVTSRAGETETFLAHLRLRVLRHQRPRAAADQLRQRTAARNIQRACLLGGARALRAGYTPNH